MNKPIVGITGDGENGDYSVKMVYSQAVERAGALPVFLSPPSAGGEIKGLAGIIDALLIPGGADINPTLFGEKPDAPVNPVSPERFYFEKAILGEIMISRKPLFCICYGMQLLNVLRGGTLYHDLARQKADAIKHKSRHRIKIYNRSKLYYILGIDNIRVNSTHHQGIKKLGRGLISSAHSRDNLVEAIELKNYPYCVGVQWHPERLLDRYSEKLFKSFVNTARAGGRAS